MKKAAIITTGLLAALILAIATVGAGTVEAQRFKFKRPQTLGKVRAWGIPQPDPIPRPRRAFIGKHGKGTPRRPVSGPKGNQVSAIPINIP
jgi:hypothetical protein